MLPKSKFNARGVLLIIFIVLIGLLLFIAAYIYNDVKKVELGMLNLYEQLKTTNNKIDQFSVADEGNAQKAMKFTEATKNWQMYQNHDYFFQFKSPADWGGFTLVKENEAVAGDKETFRYFGNFNKPIEDWTMDWRLISYGFPADRQKVFASVMLKDALNKNKSGECPNDVFQQIKSLNIGEIRNCYIKENILNQKYISYRYFNQKDGDAIIDELIAVFPRDRYYIKISLPINSQPEAEYFIQSLVFLN